jgi:hypothetical protein
MRDYRPGSVRELFKADYWYLRLKGHEIYAVDFKRKSYGNTYALQNQANEPRTLANLLMKLCEKTGTRLRHAKYSRPRKSMKRRYDFSICPGIKSGCVI